MTQNSLKRCRQLGIKDQNTKKVTIVKSGYSCRRETYNVIEIRIVFSYGI